MTWPLVMVSIKDSQRSGSGDERNKNANKQEEVHNADIFDADPIKPSAKAASALRLEEFGIRKPSWMQTEAMPQVGIKNEASQVARQVEGKTIDLRPESLLARKDVRALLFIDVVYSVCACCSWLFMILRTR